jgi:hypothetical protein
LEHYDDENNINILFGNDCLLIDEDINENNWLDLTITEKDINHVYFLN